ncbi:ElaA protein [Alkalihalobacillus xiaoxiensis]|uniref:ElaA protein n=1 Tax=Shouchella xiaoxiensis TaxID=766895 RepID=A0ABS2STS4_9BACI|nr:GNAT family N-acetyltransferase [Shouchella xiaoxiensis]MBM7838930.1 ElaA protein [Shouchella xiaoxiensis]
MEWSLKQFNELSPGELYAIIKARIEVFVMEQRCIFQDLDDIDQESYHLFLMNEKEVAAYARLIPSGVEYVESSIGRVLVSKAYRGQGLGHVLMEQGMDFLTNQLKEKTIKLKAEFYIKELYEEYGFKQISAIFLEDEIEHAYMLYQKGR